MGIQYLSAEEIKTHYTEIKPELKKQPNYFIRTEILKDKIKDLVSQDKKILDIGCGSGELARQLINLNYKNLYLIDIDNYLIPEVENKVIFHKEDVCYNKLPYKECSMNVVLLIAVLEHLENPFLIIREIDRVLKPGGLFFMAIPYIFNLRSRLQFLFKGNIVGYNKGNNHISLFTKDIFEKVILDKFIIKDVIYSKGFIKFMGKKIIFNSKVPESINKLFANKVLYIFQKNNRKDGQRTIPKSEF